jgi:5'-nucleotidase
MRVLLTNDDGIDSPGLHALHDALADAGHDVTVVAPAEDQSAVGRAIDGEVDLREGERGYAVEGTPATCVVAGVEALGVDPDLVVAGCNEGANLGMYVLGRSGTVSAAVEATYFDLPALAVSMYIPGEIFGDDHGHAAYAEAARATVHLADAEAFGAAGYLNINVPYTADEPAMVVTEPSRAYEMAATREGDRITLHDEVWERLDGDCPDPVGTDRRTVADGDVSVSPLTAPHATEGAADLENLAATYRGTDGQ